MISKRPAAPTIRAPTTIAAANSLILLPPCEHTLGLVRFTNTPSKTAVPSDSGIDTALLQYQWWQGGLGYAA